MTCSIENKLTDTVWQEQTEQCPDTDTNRQLMDTCIR